MVPPEVLKSYSCVFGGRILKVDVPSKRKPIMVPNKPTIVQRVFLQNKEFIRNYSWTIKKFRPWKILISSLSFEVCGHKWNITMFPYGNGYVEDFVSLYLNLHDPRHLPPRFGMIMIELILSIVDQEHGQHYTHQGRLPFSRETNWGWPYFVPLKTLKDPSKGYIVGSKCIVKADITIIGSYKY
ncbi:unnamed protein product [Urochloa humidicola]